MPELWFPVSLGFCPSEETWDKLMDSCKIRGVLYPQNRSSGGMFNSFHAGADDGFYTFGVVTVSDRAKEYDPSVLCGILVHESVHAFQFMCRVMGEKKPSIEFEAYAIQTIFQFMEGAFSKTREWSEHYGQKKQATEKDRSAPGPMGPRDRKRVPRVD